MASHSQDKEGTSHEASDQPKPCGNNCGFFGAAATMNLCSKCYRRFLDEAAPAKAPLEVVITSSTTVVGDGDDQAKGEMAAANQCWSCKKKVGLTGVRCKCGRTFCGTHFYLEMHECTFDFMVARCDMIAKGNPVIKADKLHRF